MGEIDGAFRAWGFAKKWFGWRDGLDCQRGARTGGGNPHGCAGSAGNCQKWAGSRCLPSKMGMSSSPGWLSQPPIRAALFCSWLNQKYFPADFLTSIRNFRTPRLIWQAEYCPERTAQFHGTPRGRRSASRRDFHQPQRRLYRTRF